MSCCSQFRPNKSVSLRWVLAGCCLIIGLSIGCAISSSGRAVAGEISGPTMGTTYSVKWETTEAVTGEQVQTAVAARLAHINKLMSTYDPESELSRFNRSRETDAWFPVSPETALVVARALEISELSDGAFDPTVGRLVGLWSFGSAERTHRAPENSVIEQALQSVGAQHVAVQRDPPALMKRLLDVELDLSAIAKGYGVDAVQATLQEMGIMNSLVEIGGEVRAQGSKATGPWKLGIERPEALRSHLAATIDLDGQALATSGDYRNFFVADGQKYSHTIDPHTGRPVTHSLASASVVAEDCMTADAFATTLMVLGPERGLEFAETQDLAVCLLKHTPAGHEMLLSTRGAAIFQPEGPGPQRRDRERTSALPMFLLTAAAFGVFVSLMAIGVIFSNRQIKGSCGGLSGMKDEHGRSICESCSTPPEQCSTWKEELARRAHADDEDV